MSHDPELEADDESRGGLDWLVDPRAPEAHLEVLARPEFVVPMTGSGISVPAGYPSGKGLAAELVRLGREAGLTEADLDFPDPRSLADVLVGREAIDRAELLSFIGAIYEAKPTGTSDTIEGLLHVRSRRVVTLNYDISLETRAGELGIECESLVLADDATRVLQVLAADAERDKLVVIHAHGIANRPSTIVLDAQGYSDLLNTPYVGACLWLLITNSRLLLMGTQLDELHILDELIRLRFLHKHHLLVTSKSAAEDLMHAERSPLVPERYLVLVRGYDDHSDLVPLVTLLGASADAEPVGPTPVGGTFPTVELARPADYVETLMVEKREPQDDDFAASYFVALGLRAPVALEQVVAIGARTLVEGLPGSGKTTLLLEVGSRQPKQVIALRLRAPQLDIVGDPKLLLPRWLETASAFRANENRDPARLDKEVFHFLIDGLDEVPYPQQVEAAAKIIEVAAANPVHTFTVASRTIPAIEEFSRPEWVRVVLAPTTNWREAYLEKRGVTWDQLVEVGPLLHDLRGLLELPFFLSQTVALYEQGALAEAADMLSLVSRFVDAGLHGIEETLPTADVRPWLRQLALAMTLAGRSDITVDEIAATLPSALRDYGDAAAVAERLVSAPLLRPSGDRRYTFVHRIFGEVLAAEALLELEPEASGILDVAVPVVSERVRGVRTDWLVPITLVAATSDSWRQAVASRDPLAAARAIPSNAALDERVRAARLIWETYVGWRIWISDYRRMTIVEDESVLARLLGTDGLDELHAEIRAAISAEARETVGNAIKVLATLGDRTIEPQLRQILEANDDYVLRRMAAIAARDLKLDALFYLIAHRALHPAESTEAQDLTFAALDLASVEDLFGFALRAATRGGETIGLLGHVIQGRLSARDELAVLRAWASRRTEPLVSERGRLLELLPTLPLDDEEIAESALFVAGSWHVLDGALDELAKKRPQAAVRAAIDLVQLDAAHIFELNWIFEQIDLECLVEGGATEAMLQHKQTLDEWKQRRGE